MVWPPPMPPKSSILLHPFHSTSSLYPDDVCMFPQKNSCFLNNSDFIYLKPTTSVYLQTFFFLQCPGLSWDTVVVPISLESSYSKKPNRAL